MDGAAPGVRLPVAPAGPGPRERARPRWRGCCWRPGPIPGARRGGAGSQWTPLLCAVAGEANAGITALLLEHGARPDDHVLYLAAFDDSRECLRLLLPYAPDIAATTALSAPISAGDVTAARLLLGAGADPNHLLDAGLLGESHEQEPPVPPLSAAVALGAGAELTGLLLEYGADPDRPGPDGRTPYQQAVRTGHDQVADLLARHGAGTALSAADELLAVCRRADRAAATTLLAADPHMAGQLTADDYRPWPAPPARAPPRRSGSCSTSASRRAASQEQTTAPPRCTWRPPPAPPQPSGCCWSAAPTSRPATPPGTPPRSDGPSSAVACGSATPRTPTGPLLSPPCSRPRRHRRHRLVARRPETA